MIVPALVWASLAEGFSVGLSLSVGAVIAREVIHTGSQRQPSLSSHSIDSPSPATPVTPWSSSRQYSPGS
jgi:hypothetical protein